MTHGYSQDAGLPAREPCSACGKADMWIVYDNLCVSCYARLVAARRDARGRPGVRVEPCPICGRIGRLRARDDWCDTCHQRWRAQGWPGDRPEPAKRLSRPPADWLPREKKPPILGRKAADLDKLTILRVMWALAHPAEENPYECVAPGCHETAIPIRQNHCVLHELRLRRNGTYGGYDCIQCGAEVRRRGTQRRECILCDSCRQTWGYCTAPSHQGERLLPREGMRKKEWWSCRECHRAYLAARRRSAGVPTREEWLASIRHGGTFRQRAPL